MTYFKSKTSALNHIESGEILRIILNSNRTVIAINYLLDENSDSFKIEIEESQ